MYPIFLHINKVLLDDFDRFLVLEEGKFSFGYNYFLVCNFGYPENDIFGATRFAHSMLAICLAVSVSYSSEEFLREGGSSKVYVSRSSSAQE